MSKEILLVAEAVSNEKGVPEAVIFDALEAALASATKKRYGEEIDARVSIDRETGEYTSFRRWQVVEEEELEIPTAQYTLEQAQAIQSGIGMGEYIEEQIDNVAFGRIAAQTAKQVIVQKVREAERARVVEQYSARVGELLMGTVKRVDRNGVFIDLGENAEGFIPRENMIQREQARVGDRLRGYLAEVRAEQRGPQLWISRTAPEFMVELFKLEVPEIAQGMIEIVGCARDAGLRAKIAVKSNDQRLDPIGACIGMRGSRVQAVTNELAGERVDIILHDDNVAQFVINAMAPAEVESIVVDEDSHSMDIAVAEEKLAQAIGRGGQNIKLASELSGWELNVMTAEQAEEKSEKEAEELVQQFMESLQVDEEVALILVQEGFSTVDEVAYVPASELEAIDEFDAEIVEELRNRARDVLLTKMIASEEDMEDQRPADDLLALDGMDDATAFALAAAGIVTQEDLADQGTDELLEIEGIENMTEERAAALIMAARAPWFEDSSADQA